MLVTFFKGLAVGVGGIAPGLSGSVLLVIFGLYQKTIGAISSIVKDFFALVLGIFKKPGKEQTQKTWKSFWGTLLFLLPLFAGCGVGVVLFSKLVDFLLENFEMYTRYAFLGLILGTVPLFWREVKKEGFDPKYTIAVVAALGAGIAIFYLNGNMFPTVTDPSLVQRVVLGIAVAGSAIIPGVDSAAILSSLGLYELWVSSVADLDLAVLIPAALGLVIGVLAFTFLINALIGKCYTLTFSVIFGLFLSIIPTVLNESCALGLNTDTAISAVMFLLGLAASLFFSNLEKLKDKAAEGKAE